MALRHALGHACGGGNAAARGTMQSPDNEPGWLRRSAAQQQDSQPCKPPVSRPTRPAPPNPRRCRPQTSTTGATTASMATTPAMGPWAGVASQWARTAAALRLASAGMAKGLLAGGEAAHAHQVDLGWSVGNRSAAAARGV